MDVNIKTNSSVSLTPIPQYRIRYNFIENGLYKGRNFEIDATTGEVLEDEIIFYVK